MKERLLDLVRDQLCLTEGQISKYNSRGGQFDNAFVINMATRTDRLKSATHTLDKVGVKFERFLAISGAKLNQKTDYYKKKFPLLRDGELGCLLSHLSIAALAASHSNQDAFTLVFEDDVVTSSGQDSWKNTLNELSELNKHESIDIIYFGKCLESCGGMTHIKDNIYRAVAPSCTHALGIKNSYARKLLLDIDNCSNTAIDCEFFNRGIDSIYGDMIVYGWSNGIVLHPAMFYQDVLTGGSDLRTEYMINYQECNDTNPHKEKECDQGDRGEWKINRQKRLIVLLIVLIIVVVIAFLCYWQKGFLYNNLIAKTPNRNLILIILLTCIILIPLLIIFIINSVKVLKEEASNAKRCEENSTKFTPNLDPGKSLITLTSSCKSYSFDVDKSAMASKRYDVFNPNGIWHKNSFLVAMRCFNGKVSYPIMHEYDKDFNRLIFSKKLTIKDRNPIVNKNYLGFEDMRIFRYHEDLYLIGVNLDRSISDLPSMCLVKLNKYYETLNVWHLKFAPLAAVPNKNWSPLTLPDGELGFIVDIDPLLIVKRRKIHDKAHSSVYSSDCEVAYSAVKQTAITKLRNSTVTIPWKGIPDKFRESLSRKFSLNSNPNRYLLMGHTKYVESDYNKDGYLVLYQHHFVLIELADESSLGHHKVYISDPFYVEQDHRPHIEYISGFCFRGSDELVIMYGLRDKETKYLVLDSSNFDKYL